MASISLIQKSNGSSSRKALKCPSPASTTLSGKKALMSANAAEQNSTVRKTSSKQIVDGRALTTKFQALLKDCPTLMDNELKSNVPTAALTSDMFSRANTLLKRTQGTVLTRYRWILFQINKKNSYCSFCTKEL
jgi:hypothetical protein